MTEMIDGKGTIRHLPDPGSYRQQVARDMLIYAIARCRWVELMNRKAEGK